MSARTHYFSIYTDYLFTSPPHDLANFFSPIFSSLPVSYSSTIHPVSAGSSTRVDIASNLPNSGHFYYPTPPAFKQKPGKKEDMVAQTVHQSAAYLHVGFQKEKKSCNPSFHPQLSPPFPPRLAYPEQCELPQNLA